MKLKCMAWGLVTITMAGLAACGPKATKPSTAFSLSSPYSSYGTFRGLTQAELEQIWEDAGTLNPTGEGARLAFMVTKETPEGPQFRTFDVWGKRSPLISQRSRDIVGKAILSEAQNLSRLRWHSISMAPYSIDSRAGAGVSDKDLLAEIMRELSTSPKELISYTEDSIFFLVTFIGYEGFDQLPFLVKESDTEKLPIHLRTLVSKAIEHSQNYEGLRRAEGERVAKLKGQKAKEVIKSLKVTMKDLPKK